VRENPVDRDRRIEELERRLTEVERRLALFERVEAAGAAGAPSPPAESFTASADAPRFEPDGSSEPFLPIPPARVLVPLIGRSLVVMGGAFLLRFITESGHLQQLVGASLALLYSFLWLQLAWWAGRRGDRLGAGFHGLTTAMIAYPLLFETTVIFQTVPPLATAVLLALVGISFLIVARAADPGFFPWLGLSGAAPLALVLAVATSRVLPFSLCLLALALGSLCFGYSTGRVLLGWLLASLIDLWVLALTLLKVTGIHLAFVETLEAGELMALLLAFMIAYLSSFAARTLLQRREVSLPGMVQVICSVLLGLGGAILVGHTQGAGTFSLGLLSIILAAACYLVSFLLIDRREGARRTFALYTSLALLFALVGCSSLFSGQTLAGSLTVAALVLAWIGSARQRFTLSLHAALYLSAAAVAASLPQAFCSAFIGSAPELAGEAPLVLLILLLITVPCAAFKVATHGRTWRRLTGVPTLLTLLVGLLSLGVLAVVHGHLLLAGMVESESEAVALAALRITVLSLSAVGLTLLGRVPRLASARMLVLPVLLLGAVKILVEDIPMGDPLGLFLALGVYGGALVFVPRLHARAAE